MRIPYNYILVITWMCVIFLLSSEGSDISSSRSDAVVEVVRHISSSGLSTDILTFLTRKAAHITAYFILGILMYLVVKTYHLNARTVIILSIIFVGCYAVSDEFHQLFVSGRSGEVRDILIDTTAGAVGVSVLALLSRRHSRDDQRTTGKKSHNKI